MKIQKKTQLQIRTLAAGGILIGALTSLFSPHSLSNIPFVIGIVSIILGFAAVVGK